MSWFEKYYCTHMYKIFEPIFNLEALWLSMGQKLRTMNQLTIRAMVEGFNMGRVPVMQGLVQTGINVVSWQTKIGRDIAT